MLKNKIEAHHCICLALQSHCIKHENCPKILICSNKSDHPVNVTKLCQIVSSHNKQFLSICFQVASRRTKQKLPKSILVTLPESPEVVQSHFRSPCSNSKHVRSFLIKSFQNIFFLLLAHRCEQNKPSPG